MIPNQINAAIAECLGWKLRGQDSFSSLWTSPSGTRSREIPDYFNDWNTRPEMLKALSEDEWGKLQNLIVNEHVSSVDWDGLTTKKLCDSLIKKLLNLSQPQFAELFLRVKGQL